MSLEIRRDDLTDPRVHRLLEQHLDEMRSISPPDSVHALDLARLRRPEIAFWTVWEADTLLGCGALKQLAPDHGEIKSMRVDHHQRGRGIGAMILDHLIATARAQGIRRLSLETGSQAAFLPARKLYAQRGFEECPPFADYRLDPHSVFMTLTLTPSEPARLATQTPG